MYEVVCFGYDCTVNPNPLKDRRIFCNSKDEMLEAYELEVYNPYNFSVQAREYKVIRHVFRQ